MNMYTVQHIVCLNQHLAKITDWSNEGQHRWEYNANNLDGVKVVSFYFMKHIELRVLREKSARQYQQMVFEKIRKNFMPSWLPFFKLKGYCQVGCHSSNWRATGSWNIQIYKNS